MALGSNGYQAKIVSSLHTTCATPTNVSGGLAETNLVFKEKSEDEMNLIVGPSAREQSAKKATRAVF